jgi:hypothetical protein
VYGKLRANSEHDDSELGGLKNGFGPARLRSENEDQKHGIDIVRKAIQTPARQIAINAGGRGGAF